MVSLFPLSPLCTCLSSIDNFGDHLLSCSQRIRRNDALINIIYNVLSQDHPGVLKEQRASYDDGSRPGDVFILIFRMAVQLSLTSLCALSLCNHQQFNSIQLHVHF